MKVQGLDYLICGGKEFLRSLRTGTGLGCGVGNSLSFSVLRSLCNVLLK